MSGNLNGNVSRYGGFLGTTTIPTGAPPGPVDPATIDWAINNSDPRQSVVVTDSAGRELALTPAFSTGEAYGGAASSLPASFLGQLQPASWRGQQFAVLGSTVRAGRRKALHEYPFRDGLWVEDLGQRGRMFGFNGFLVGDDVGQQMEDFLRRAEYPGPGELVHPTFGARRVELLECEAGDRFDAGRVWSLRLEFVEPRVPRLQLQPEGVGDTSGAVAQAAADAQAAASGDFLTRIGSALKSGYAAVKGVVAAVRPYALGAVRLAGDAIRLLNSVRHLVGGRTLAGGGSGQPFTASLGRYSLGLNGPIGAIQGGLRTAAQVDGAVRGAVTLGTKARGLVDRAASDLSRLVDL